MNEFDIDFSPATTIKSQAITDFIVELTHVESNLSWLVEVNIVLVAVPNLGLAKQYIN